MESKRYIILLDKASRTCERCRQRFAPYMIVLNDERGANLEEAWSCRTCLSSEELDLFSAPGAAMSEKVFERTWQDKAKLSQRNHGGTVQVVSFGHDVACLKVYQETRELCLQNDGDLRAYADGVLAHRMGIEDNATVFLHHLAGFLGYSLVDPIQPDRWYVMDRETNHRYSDFATKTAACNFCHRTFLEGAVSIIEGSKIQ